ncbi:MAG TPA: hypothetical protein VFS05_02345 [Gemmatimonadaceae bacterium]|nr:hypothetical protein [Gemmatimonadaceae bacterium]
MPRPNLVAQLYGYLVCLVAVITFLVSANSLVNNAYDLADPLYAQRYGRDVPPSFALYREEVLAGRIAGGPPARPTAPAAEGQQPAARPLPTDAELREMYDALRADKIRTVRHQSLRAVTTSALLIVVSILLFVTHFLWMRRLRATE